MFEVGSFPCGTCQGVTRRTFLRAGFAAPFALTAAGSALATAAETARAKSVLLVWLGGGPSHLDLFDPKPKAPAEYRGPFTTIATRTPGVSYTELLPKLAARSHKYSLIRSNVNFNGGHREAGSIALTGATAATEIYPPNFGSIVARQRGHDALPPFISLARGPIGDGVGPIQGSGGGTWGHGHDPFLIGCTEKGHLEIPSLKLASGLSPARLEDRRYLLGELDRIARDAESSSRHDDWDQLRQRALALLSSPQGVAALDLSREAPATREAYGNRRSVKAVYSAGDSSRPACRLSRSTGVAMSKCTTASPTMAGTRTPTISACWPNGTAPSSTGSLQHLSTTWNSAGF